MAQMISGGTDPVFRPSGLTPSFAESSERNTGSVPPPRSRSTPSDHTRLFAQYSERNTGSIPLPRPRGVRRPFGSENHTRVYLPSPLIRSLSLYFLFGASPDLGQEGNTPLLAVWPVLDD